LWLWHRDERHDKNWNCFGFHPESEEHDRWSPQRLLNPTSCEIPSKMHQVMFFTHFGSQQMYFAEFFVVCCQFCYKIYIFAFLGILCFCFNNFLHLGIYGIYNVRNISHTLKCWVSVFVMLSEGALWFGIFSYRLKVTRTKSSLDSQQQKWGEFVLHQCILMFRIFCKHVFSGLFWGTISFLMYINEENFFFPFTKDRISSRWTTLNPNNTSLPKSIGKFQDKLWDSTSL
jgi:hypothetical protein